MNNQENKILPILRFPEFNSEYKDVGFSELGKIKIGLTHKPDYIESGIPFLSSKNISNGYIDFNDINYISREKFTSMPESTKPKVGDILFTRVGSNLGNPIIVKEDIEFGIFVSLGFFRVNSKTNNQYVRYWMDSDLFWKQVEQKVAGGAKMNLNSTWLKEFRLAIPTQKEEQQKVAKCLSSLDEVITAEDEKLDLLKDHKKGLLQQLFPAEGETQPKFRFTEFKDDGDWEETILDDVADYTNGKAHEKEISETGKYKVVNSKFISTNGEVVKFTDSANLKASVGDILMVLSDIPNGKAIAKCFYVDKEDTYTVNQRICKITPTDIDNKFLFYVQNRNKYFLAFDDGVKQTNLRKDTVLSFPFLKPKESKEQEKIANCLTLADDLIKEQANKIVFLQEHKKGLLQQLFPNIND